MNVVSYFDGMSCGQIAIDKIGISISEYMAFEINKYAVEVTQKNYPNTIQMGSVLDADLGAIKNVDLFLGGSPCQDLTRTKSERDNLDGNSSRLFWEYAKALKILKPKYFLLENVVMDKVSENIITKELGVTPIKINSRDFVPQNRERMYWTNIDIKPHCRKKSCIEDIKEVNVPESYYLTDVQLSKLNLNYKWSNSASGIVRHVGGNRQQDRIYRNTGVMACLLAGSKGSSPHLTKTYIDGRVRRLTPIEYERLQGVPDGYTNCVSDMHRYEMLGNGWTVDVIAHILSSMATE